ncbi:MAG: hypothetical protein V3T23_13455 [Nitrososphaerales archaeon]
MSQSITRNQGSQIISQLRELNSYLKPQNSFMEKFTFSKTAVVSSFDGTLKMDGQEFNLYVISTDGNIADISYQVRNRGGLVVDELEAASFAFIPGPVSEIQFKNDVAETGKSIFVTAYQISRLAPPMPPPSPPGTRSEIVDPHVLPGLARGIEVPYAVAIRTGGGVPLVLQGLLTTTNEHDALESPIGTNFQVTTDKILILFAAVGRTTNVTKGMGLSFADTGVDNSATPGTNAVNITRANGWEFASADVNTELVGFYGEIPAGKFPHLTGESISATQTMIVLGVEVDA